MKFVVMFVSVLLAAPAMAATASKADCAKYADQFSGALPNVRAFMETLDRTRYRWMIDGDGELRAAVDAADNAREATLDPLRNFITAMEDLTYELQVCAR